MTIPVKFREHIEKIWRMEPVPETRLDKIRLDKNERISPFPMSFWQNVFKDITQDMVQACPEVWPLYHRLADANNLPMDHFLLTAGSDAAIRHCFETFVSPGDKVFYPEPTFAMVTIYGALYDANMQAVNYDRNLCLDMNRLIEGIDEKTSLIVFANPNSPTGTYEDNDKISMILHRAAQYHVPVLIDEAYYGFCPYTSAGLMKAFRNLIITRSFSKIAGMAGLRVGYAMGDPEVISLLTKFRPMYEINSVGIAFACNILDHWDVAEEYGQKTREGRKLFSDFLRSYGFSVIDTETNFIHVDFGTIKGKILENLIAQGILVRGMLTVQGYENYTRFSVGPWESMSTAVKALNAILKSE